MNPRIKDRFQKSEEGEWVYPIMRGFKHACCDCGLVHRFNLRVKEVNGKPRVQWQIFRDNRATGALRRWMRKRGEIE